MNEHTQKTFKKTSSMHSLLAKAYKKAADGKEEKKENLIKELISLLDKMQENDITLDDIKIIVDAYIAGQITVEE